MTYANPFGPGELTIDQDGIEVLVTKPETVESFERQEIEPHYTCPRRNRWLIKVKRARQLYLCGAGCGYFTVERSGNRKKS